MKINAHKIGLNRYFVVKPTVKVYTNANKMLIKALKVQQTATRLDGIDPDDIKYTDMLIESLDTEDTFVADGLEYLRTLFNLNKKQMEIVENAVPDSLSLASYVVYVIQRIKGQSDTQIEAAQRNATKEQRGESLKKE